MKQQPYLFQLVHELLGISSAFFIDVMKTFGNDLLDYPIVAWSSRVSSESHDASQMSSRT